MSGLSLETMDDGQAVIRTEACSGVCGRACICLIWGAERPMATLRLWRFQGDNWDLSQVITIQRELGSKRRHCSAGRTGQGQIAAPPHVLTRTVLTMTTLTLANPNEAFKASGKTAPTLRGWRDVGQLVSRCLRVHC